MTTPTLKDAIELATRAHAGQKDKAQNDYITHPLRVMEAVQGEEAKIVAVLHDTIEDTFVTAAYLREQGYPEEIVVAVEALTKRPDEENSDEGYHRFVMRAGSNPLARVVKIADLHDNMNLARIAQPTEKDHERNRRYARALVALGAQ
jgi:(p)ppGpp synthase/HD superfamily hydrolase